jgi:hypothetical protein
MAEAVFEALDYLRHTMKRTTPPHDPDIEALDQKPRIEAAKAIMESIKFMDLPPPK